MAEEGVAVAEEGVAVAEEGVGIVAVVGVTVKG